MPTFSDLIRATTQHCNRVGKMLALAVFVFGTIGIIGQAVFMVALTTETQRVARELATPEERTELDLTISTHSGMWDPGAVLDASFTVLEKKYNAAPEPERQQFVWDLISTSLRRSFVWILISLFASAIVTLFSRVFFLVLGTSSETESTTHIAVRSLKIFPAFIAIWLLILLILVPWIPLLGLILSFVWPEGSFLLVLGFLPIIVLLPRLVLAPVIFVQDHVGVVESLRQSMQKTSGQWMRLIANFLGVGALVWIVMTLSQALLNFLIRLSSPINAAAWWLGLFLSFVAILGTAYKMIFTIHLKESVMDHQIKASS